MAVLDHFLFNSDYPTDKILWAKTEIITLHSTSSNRSTQIEFDTGIKGQLYAEGDYKLTTSDEVAPMLDVAGSFIGPEDLFVSIYSYMKNGTCWIGINWYDFTANCSYNNKKVEYRAWAYGSEEGTKNVDTGPTVNVAKNVLTLDSDADYPRLVGEGLLLSNQTVTHSMGFIPLVKYWRLYPNQTMPSGETTDVYMNVARGFIGDASGTTANLSDEINVTKATLKAAPLRSSETITYYYRMYA